MTITPLEVFIIGVMSSAAFLLLRDQFFTKMFTYTYGFTFTGEDGRKAYSEVQTLSMTKPNDVSFFHLAQQSIRENGFRGYNYIDDPQFQLAYAMYVNSCWRRTATLLKAQEERKRKEKAREEAAADESTDSDKAA